MSDSTADSRLNDEKLCRTEEVSCEEGRRYSCLARPKRERILARCAKMISGIQIALKNAIDVVSDNPDKRRSIICRQPDTDVPAASTTLPVRPRKMHVRLHVSPCCFKRAISKQCKSGSSIIDRRVAYISLRRHPDRPSASHTVTRVSVYIYVPPIDLNGVPLIIGKPVPHSHSSFSFSPLCLASLSVAPFSRHRRKRGHCELRQFPLM